MLNRNSFDNICFSQAVSPALRENLLKQMRKIDSFRKILTYDNISYDTRIAILSDMKDEKKLFVDSVHTRSIWFNEKMELWCTKIHVVEKDGDTYKKVLRRKTAKTKEKLYDSLYEFYSGTRINITMSDLYQETLPQIAGRMGAISDVTRKEYSRMWNKFWLPRIGDKKIADISAAEWRSLFVSVITENSMTKKQFGNAVTILNHIMEYCLVNGLIQTNPIRDIVRLKYPYQPEVAGTFVKTEGLSLNQLEKIEEWCLAELERPRVDQLSLYAMLFNMKYGLRFGELSGLKWSDVDLDEGEFIIRRQRCRQVHMNSDLSFEELQMQDIEHVKAYEDARRLPLSDEVKELLVKVKALNRSGEYVFPIRRGTYTDKLIRAVAFSKGIEPYDKNGVRNPELTGIHPHSLRVGVAGSLYHRTKNRKAVQYALGHRNPEMTEKYIKNLEVFDELKAAFCGLTP